MAKLLLPKHLHPDFQTLRKMPIGPVEIDWSNPLTRGLKLYMVASQGYKDLVLPSRTFTRSVAGAWSTVSAGPRGLFFDPGTEGALDISPFVSLNGLWTVAASSDLTDLNIFDILAYTETPFECHLIATSSTEIGAYVGGGDPAITAIDGFHTISTTQSSASGGSGYIDGELDATHAKNVTADVQTILGDNDQDARNWHETEWLAIWDRALTDVEQKSLDLDPYQILKPVAPITVEFSTASAGIVGQYLPKSSHPDFAIRNRKPVGAVEVDRSNPIGESLVSGWLIGDIQDGTIPDVTGVQSGAINNNAMTFGVDPQAGRFLQPSNNNDFIDIDNLRLRNLFLGGPWSLVFHARSINNLNDKAVFSVNGTDDFVVYLVEGTFKEFRIFWRDGGGSRLIVSLTDLDMNLNIFHQFAITYDGAGNLESYIDGTSVATDTITEGSLGPFSDGPRLLHWAGSGSQNFVGKLASAFIFDKRLSSGEMASLGTDLYQVLKPSVPVPYFIGADAPAGTTVNATLDTLTITDFDATVQADVDLDVSATLDTLTIADFDATVQADVDLNVSATLDTLTITDFDTTIGIGQNISATLDTLSITDFDTTVQADVDLNVSATLDTLTITDFDTTVVLGVNIAATTDTLTITDFDATVQADVDLNILATLDTLGITDFPTTVTTGAFVGIPIDGVEESVIDTDFGTKKIYFNGTSYFTY